MFTTARARIAVVCLLLLGHAALFPLFALQPVNEDAGVYADESKFLEEPDQYLNGPVVSGGIVESTEPIVIRVDTVSGTERVTITDVAIDPTIGDKARVYGTLIEPATIDSHNAFVVPQQGQWYAWGISFVAGLWVLARLIRHWTVEWSTLAFKPRTEPLTIQTVTDWIGRQWRRADA